VQDKDKKTGHHALAIFRIKKKCTEFVTDKNIVAEFKLY